MATAIHHGPPGSFKSFTLVQRFVIPALIEGRTVICNIRALNSLANIKAAFPDVEFKETAKLINIDTSEKAGRDLIAGWFHWIPFKAMVVIDEGQRVYPDRREFKLESLDRFVSPSDDWQIDALPENRPEDIFTAYDMQRHFEWDIFISTTNIVKIHKQIRESSEWGYRHRSLQGTLPAFLNKLIGDRWIEHQHDPENTGKAESHRVGSPTIYKADTRIYKCYQSTATGEITASQAGRSIFSDTRFRINLFIIVLAVCLLLYFTNKESSHPVKNDVKSSASSAQTVEDNSHFSTENLKNTAPAVSAFHAKDDANGINHVSIRQDSRFFNDVLGYQLVSIASHQLKNQWQATLFFDAQQAELAQIPINFFTANGIKVDFKSLCTISLTLPDNQTVTLRCGHPLIERCKAQLKTNNEVKYFHCKKIGATNEKL